VRLISILLVEIDMDDHEELLINIIGALANYTFYMDPSNCIWSRRIDILHISAQLLSHPHPDAVEQSLRCLANISRDPGIREKLSVPIWAGSKPVLEMIAESMVIEEREILIHACGAVANAVSVASVDRVKPPSYRSEVAISIANGRCFKLAGGVKT
jgi:hypothetical protein